LSSRPGERDAPRLALPDRDQADEVVGDLPVLEERALGLDDARGEHHELAVVEAPIVARDRDRERLPVDGLRVQTQVAGDEHGLAEIVQARARADRGRPDPE
jgi:hypothetical protein